MQFEAVDLGDQRRNRRLVQLTDQLVRHPGGTLPEKLPKPADLEAFYRLLDADEVTHAAVLAPHRERVLQKLHTTEDYLLVVHDGTEFDFSSRTSLQQLGQIGNGRGRGYIVQQSLVVDPQRGAVEGLVSQILHKRPEVSKREWIAARRARESRESLLWLRGTEGLPARRQVVDVCDRGADTFEFLEHEFQSKRTFVIRACHDRAIQLAEAPAQAPTVSLFEHLRSCPAQTTTTTTVRIPVTQRSRSSHDLPTLRTAQLQLTAVPIRVLAPHVHRGIHGDEALSIWAVRIWEPAPPAGCDPLEWVLLTNHSCRTVRALRQVQSWYEWRWVIEEFHKGQKSGCDIERLQLRDESRLEPALAVLSIVALTLLQLRDAARDPGAHSRRAAELVSPEAILLLSQWTEGRPRPHWTLHEYALALAKLGGYRVRKNCPPGWLVLWRGHTKLELMLDGARAIQEAQTKCAKR